MTVPFANEIMHGEHAVTITARVAITMGGGECPEGAVKIIAGVVGFTDPKTEFSRSEYEVWDCDVIIVPKRKYRKGPFVGWRLDQVITSLGVDLKARFKQCEEIEP